MLVQPLVGEIDEELLQRISLKVFKPVDVKDSQETGVAALAIWVHQAVIHLLDDPTEELGVDGFGESIARGSRLIGLERNLHFRTLELHGARCETLLQEGLVCAEQFRRILQLSGVGHNCLAIGAFGEGDVAEVDQPRQRLEERGLQIGTDADRLEDLADLFEISLVPPASPSRLPGRRTQIRILVGVSVNQMLLAVSGRDTGDKLVIDVVSALIHSVLHDASALKQIRLD
mmetsp:Transcript_4405/g.8520  ORF Transcript_4405/g.8520 Transcript_4405/m.8520 type:complete len:231 (-) Transcript_4405:603-1295(-)